jgi:hypothetical protein
MAAAIEARAAEVDILADFYPSAPAEAERSVA